MFEKHSVTIPFAKGRDLTLETGHIARQAHGSIIARVGDTVVMANTVRSNKPMEHADFFPLMVDYREKHYAIGKIPGNFFRREGRPGTAETITARLIDRTIRPLFPKGFRYDIQVYITILSMDQKNPAPIVALVAASAALSISDIPFAGPVGATRLGCIDDVFVVNPTFEELEKSTLDLILGGTHSAITMVESGSKFLTEARMIEAFEEGSKSIQATAEGIDRLVALCGKEKISYEEPSIDSKITDAVAKLTAKGFKKINKLFEKTEREDAGSALKKEVMTELLERFAPAAGEEPRFETLESQIKEAYGAAYKKNVRLMVLRDKVRADGRRLDEVREIDIALGFLPMAHGSVVFTRGQTQSLGVTTLGTVGDKPKIDDLRGLNTERFMLHYNFPSYSVGETRRIMGPGRRELGHGMLAQRGLEPILPDEDNFPYTVRIVSEITESNGSSSMASVCSGCLSLMDAGVPIKAPVAGIAMGLIKEGDDIAILTDIMGMEDHLGDMDFKVTGTREGITALQMDIKCKGLGLDIMTKALAQALKARLHILDKMAEAMPEARPELSSLAPRIEIMKIDPETIGSLIGPSGKHIRGIVEATGAKIDVEDDGSVFISSSDGDSMKAAKQMVLEYTASPEIGKVYEGKVVRITDFGCFVEILPKKDGLVHVSELDFHRVEKVTDVCREGDMMKVKCIDIDPGGKVRLSRKQALADEPGFVMPPDAERGGGGAGGGGGGGRPDRPRHGGGGRPPRGGGGVDRGGMDRGGPPRRDGGDRGRGGRGRD